MQRPMTVAGEHRGDVGGVFAQVQPARGGHPLVEMRDSLLGRRAEGLDVGGDHDACGPSEQHRLDVVPLARDRVHVVRFPEACGGSATRNRPAPPSARP